jgi:hypothetical protein
MDTAAGARSATPAGATGRLGCALAHPWAMLVGLVTGRDDDPTADRLLAAFALWSADQRVGQAAGARSRERWLRRQAADAATLIGTLIDLAERCADVALVVGARSVTGRLAGVGRDACVIAEPSGTATVVPLARLVAVRVAGRRTGLGEATGERAGPGGWAMADALAALAAERSPVRLGLKGGEVLSGVLVTVGEDVLTLQLPVDGARAYVALAALETATPI